MMMFYMALIDDEADQLTFQRIHDRFSKEMYHVAFSVLHDFHDAEDAVQDALLNLAKYIKRVPTENENVTRAYVKVVARNAARQLRARSSETLLYDDLVAVQPVSDEDVFDQVATGQNYELLLRCVEKMPLHYAEVLMMHYSLDFATREIAAQLGRSAKTVQQQLYRGKIMLKALYEQEVGDHG